ncbi:MAG: hypothetical protein ACLVG9_02215, partial [Eubacteriales bacterium]
CKGDARNDKGYILSKLAFFVKTKQKSSALFFVKKHPPVFLLVQSSPLFLITFIKSSIKSNCYTLINNVTNKILR